MVLRNLLVRIGADTSGLQSGMRDAQKRLKKFGNSVQKSMGSMRGGIAGALSGIAGGFFIKQGVEDAIKYEALMGTLSESLGSSIKDFQEWQNQVGESIGYSKVQSAELANILSLNFKKIATNQADLLNKTTKMMEVAAVISNKRGMLMTEVSDRIRSAMNGEADAADELGVNVRVAVIEASESYKALGVSGPWDKLSENIRKTILYNHILEQVSGNLGDTLKNNVQLKLNVFSASLGDVRMALGSAFLPILNVVLPILTAFMRKLESALQSVSNFMRGVFGIKASKGANKQAEATNNQAKAVSNLGDASETAGKQIKKASRGVLGFDEVNILPDPESGGGGGGGAGGGLDIPEDEPQNVARSNDLFDAFEGKISKLGVKVRKFFKESQGWDYFIGGLEKFWKSLDDFWNSPAIMNFRKAFVEDLPDFFDDLLQIGGGVFTTLAGTITWFTGVLNGNFPQTMKGLAQQIGGAFNVLSGIVGLIFPDMGKALDKFGAKFGEVWNWFYNTFIKDSASIGETVNKLGGFILAKITETVMGVIGFFTKMAIDVVIAFGKLKSGFTEVLKIITGYVKTKATEIWGDFTRPFKNAYNWFVTNMVNPIISAFGKIKGALGGAITGGFKTVYNTAVSWLNSMIKDINKIKIKGVWAGVNISTIPKLATGGITSGPTLAMIGDNLGGKEVVSPLDQLQSYVTNAVLTAMKFNNGNTNDSDSEIVLNIDGRSFARLIKPHLDKESKRMGTNLRLNNI